MLHLYYRKPKREPRWIQGDQYLRNFAASVIDSVRPRSIGGVERVFLNLCKGLDQIGAPYRINQPFSDIKPADSVGVLGLGRTSLEGYTQDNEVVAGIALMTHPSEWPDLCENYPIRAYLQHSEWAANLYRPYYGNKVGLWPAGIDTEAWKPQERIQAPEWDVLLYNKIRWNHERQAKELLDPIRKVMLDAGATVRELKPGAYSPKQYRQLLQSSRSMVFVCEHESQGLACQEALSSGVPVFAWDQGFCLDPNYELWEGGRAIPATSVPFFDERCGERFRDASEFAAKFHEFLTEAQMGSYLPRTYILENLTLAKSAERFLEFFLD